MYIKKIFPLLRSYFITEKGKMTSGELYDPNLSEELKKERAKVKDLCHKYILLSPNEWEKEHEVIKKILGKLKNILEFI